MTGKQIEKLKKEIPEFINGVPCNLSSKQKQIVEELHCREMINSCLCYGDDFINSIYSEDYIKRLGLKRVLELYNEQKEDFDKAIVKHDVYIDSEDCSYNSIIWKDDLEKD